MRMEALIQDVKYSFRQFRRVPLFVAGVITTLALVVGANTLLFAIANAVFLRALPYPEPSRLISASLVLKGRDVGRMDEPTARLAAVANLPSLESLGLYNSTGVTLVGGEYAERLAGARVSRSLFDVLRVPPAAGRTFTDDEMREGGPPVVILSDAVWTRTFGRRSTIVGETIILDDRAYEVVALMPPGFSYPGRSEFWLPLVPRSLTSGMYFTDAIGRLRPTASVEQARTDLDTLRTSRKEEIPPAALRYEVRTMSLQQRLYGDFSRPLILLLGTVACVLLIGCANIANLMLARSSTRRAELAVRLAVGASRGRLFRLLLTESLVLACAGGLPGVALAFAGLRVFRRFGPPALASLPTLSIDNQVLLFTLALTIATGLLFGLAPAFGAARVNPQGALGAGRAHGRDNRWRPRRALVALEIAVAVVLTLGGALLAKSFGRFQAVDRGFHAANVLEASITLSTVRHPDAASRRAFFDALVERLRQVPSIETVSISEAGLNGLSMTMDWPPARNRHGEAWEIGITTGVGASHFRTFGIPLLEGRECAGPSDASGVVINSAMARRSYGDRSAIGQSLDLSEVSLGTRAVLGVSADVPDLRTKAAARPTVYACAGDDRAGYGTVAVRTRDDTDAMAVAPALRTAVRALDPAQPVSRITTVEQTIREGSSSRWFDAAVIGALSTLALVLALGGLYAVTAYSVAQRTREIGVRMALGADRGTVMTLVLRQGGILVLIGVGLGLAAAVPLVRLVAAMLFDVHPLDPAVFSGVAALIAIVAMLATLVPARRASRVDPMVALKAE
jgi:putative ABC transport system permease protein